MQVFRTYHRIILRKFPALILLLVAYLGLSLLYSYTDGNAEEFSFRDLKVKMTIINEDPGYEHNTALVDGLIAHLSEVGEILEVKDPGENLQKALFNNEIHAGIRIPKGFTQEFLRGDNPSIHQISIPDSPEALFIEMHINKYLNTAGLYISNMEDVQQSQVVDMVQRDLAKEVRVEVKDRESPLLQVTGNMVSHYNFLGLYLMFSIISGGGMTMMVFNKEEIVKRNNLSPLSISNRNFQLLLGNASFVLLCWALGMLLSVFIFRFQFSTASLLLFSLNALCFALTCLAVAFFIGKNIRSKNTFHSLVAIIILSMSFLGGLFIPLAFMGEQIMRIARFTPVYWFVKANNGIQSLDHLTMESFLPIGGQMAVVIASGIGIFAMTMLISKIKYVAFHSQ